MEILLSLVTYIRIQKPFYKRRWLIIAKGSLATILMTPNLETSHIVFRKQIRQEISLHVPNCCVVTVRYIVSLFKSWYPWIERDNRKSEFHILKKHQSILSRPWLPAIVKNHEYEHQADTVLHIVIIHTVSCISLKLTIWIIFQINALDILTCLSLRGFFIDAVSNWNCRASNDGMTANREFEIIWKETELA
jgi:hypothetical protein